MMNTLTEECGEHEWVDQRLRELYYGYYVDEDLDFSVDIDYPRDVDVFEQMFAVPNEECGEHNWVDQRLRELYYEYYEDSYVYAEDNNAMEVEYE